MATAKKKAKKRTVQVEVWCDDEVKVAGFINGLRAMAESSFGADNQHVTFDGVGITKLREQHDGVTWRSVKASGRMRIKEPKA